MEEVAVAEGAGVAVGLGNDDGVAVLSVAIDDSVARNCVGDGVCVTVASIASGADVVPCVASEVAGGPEEGRFAVTPNLDKRPDVQEVRYG
jgi:hypothetical protein